MKKSQASLEFMIFIGIMIFAFIIFLSVMIFHTTRYNNERAKILAEDLALAIQSEINIGLSVQDGYLRYFRLPETLEGIQYSISIDSNTISVVTDSATATASVSNLTINSNLVKGINRLEKKNGILYFN